MTWYGEEDGVCKNLIRKTSTYLGNIFNNIRRPSGNKYTGSRQSIDSAIFSDDYEDERVVRPPQKSWSRSSSICSVCSCHSCLRRGDWTRRPSMLVLDSTVDQNYRFDAVLGEGSFSTVYLGESKVSKNGWVAIKVVERSNLLKTKKISSSDSTEESDVESEPDFVSRSVMAQNDQEIMQLVDKETRIMSTLDHPHVINLEEVYEDDTRVCFVMELAQGGEVFDRLLQKVSFDEMQTADLVGQVLCAMSYIHTQGIVHRDLKLENLLYYDDTEDSKIMVADFGLSDWLEVLEDGTSPICGTPGYMAPEVISRQSCTTKADVWAIGVITYILLAGYPPFYIQNNSQEENGKSGEDNDEALLKKIVNGEYEFIEATWKNISPEAVQFIKSLMCADPSERPSCDQALTHPWLNDRPNLERRAAERMRQKPGSHGDAFSWTMGQQVAFVISILVILGSYSAMITYVFNIGKPGAMVQDLMTNVRSEFDLIYTTVYETIDTYVEIIHELALNWMDYVFCKAFT